MGETSAATVLKLDLSPPAPPSSPSSQPRSTCFRCHQSRAFDSSADILLYGGAAGGGKTDLLLGVALHQSHRAVIFRRTFQPSMQAIFDRSMQIYGGVAGAQYKDTNHAWRFRGGKLVRLASLQYEADARKWQGQPHDFYGFDEITEFSESQFRYVIGWLRTARKGQRCRVICTGNPPSTAEGEWILSFFAPWVDPTHPNPAKPGELRWFTTIEGKDVELPDGNPVEHNGEYIRPMSRTFIPALLSDNPHLGPDYRARVQALPEPLRTQLLDGDFSIGRRNDERQVIPVQLVLAAQDRWRKRPYSVGPMTVLGVDVSRGGKDRTVITPRYGNWVGATRLLGQRDARWSRSGTRGPARAKR